MPTPDPLAPLVEAWLRSAEPAAALEQLCRQHPELADDLRAHVDRIARPTVTREVASEQAAGSDSAAMPQEIGPYRLLSILGEGGMGTVYLAEQREPINRRVALKLIKVGLDTKAVVARFEAERQALALLDHPNIAKVFDAGSTRDGRPFFVMELVQGESVTDYCDRHCLDLNERQKLLVQVCRAIQHAHEHGIVHRDIKPSNVLVVERSGEHVAKVIDFGVAKATDQRLTEQTLFTEHGQMVGTPEYMSPEQATMSGAGIDGRTDVYSLGVLLYELVVGELPFSTQDLREAGYFEIQRRIREDHPPTPSQRFVRLGDVQDALARHRSTDRGKLLRALRSDIEAIAMKAMAKSPMYRYESPVALAADLDRHLSGEAVEARLPGIGERLSRWTSRNRQLVMQLGVAVLLGGAAAILVMTASEPSGKEGVDLSQVERNGWWQTLHANGQVAADGIYQLDQKEGLWLIGGRDGHVLEEGQYERGVRSGPWQFYYPGGQPKARGVYHDGRWIGPWQVWDGAAQPAWCDAGRLPGTKLVREYWPDSSVVRRVGVMTKGNKVGRWTTYHRNGELRFCCGVRSGMDDSESQMDGAFTFRAPDGTKRVWGVVRGGRIEEGTMWVDGPVDAAFRPVPLEAIQGVAPALGAWSDFSALALLPPVEQLAVLAAEVLGDPDPVLATAAPAGVAVWQLREPHQQVVQSLPVAPAPAPPATVPLTAQQLAESKARAKLIADVPVAPGEPRDQADGDAIAAQLIGKPLPFDLVVGVAGRTLDLRALRGKKVLIAVQREFLGEICLYCTAMSAMLTDQREKLADEGVAVLLVYPGEAETEPSFWRLYAETFAEVPPPYHVVYDADLRITAELGIESDYAYPTTLLINEQGIVTYAAVAASGTDRNGTAALRKAIDSLQLAESKARAKLIADVPVAPGEPRDQADGDAIAAQLIGKPLPFDLVVGVAGRTLDLRALRGKKVLIAVQRGFLGEICLYCTAMSAMLTDQREKLADEGVAVLLVYPGEAETEPSFWRLYAETFAEVPPPYHVVYDADLRITAELGIESDYAYPTTLLINEQGIVTYAAVAASGTDRNGTAALRKAIDSL